MSIEVPPADGPHRLQDPVTLCSFPYETKEKEVHSTFLLMKITKYTETRTYDTARSLVHGHAERIGALDRGRELGVAEEILVDAVCVGLLCVPNRQGELAVGGVREAG